MAFGKSDLVPIKLLMKEPEINLTVQHNVTGTTYFTNNRATADLIVLTVLLLTVSILLCVYAVLTCKRKNIEESKPEIESNFVQVKTKSGPPTA